VLLLGLALTPARAHDLGEGAHDHAAPRYDFSVPSPTRVVLRVDAVVLLAQAPAPRPPVAAPANARPSLLASAFQPFAPKVKTRADGQFLYVESDGMPAHNLMVGITAWQQQVPLPQPYTGNNAWCIPLHPVPAKTPVSIKNRFLRGAIALAANGIPIFNPQNNRGELSTEIGELDRWGGHCGRADDYHYHAAPLHLQGVLGKAVPIAYALDGYPIYGLTEPDGTAPAQLDAFNGHETTAVGYHYHASLQYPYVNGGFHGEVVERDGQVDPQPRAQPLREASAPLRDARITGFTAKDKAYSLKYEVSGEVRFVNYALNENGSVKFDFVDGRGQVRSETSSPRQRGPDGGGGGDRPPGEPKGKDEKKKGPGKGGPPPPPPPPVRGAAPPPSGERGAVKAVSYTPKRTGNFILRSPVVANGDALPVEFTGDGASATLPLEWTGAPAGTKSFAVLMDHLDPEGRAKWYWVLYNIPANVGSLAKNTQGVGTLGNNSVNGRAGYAPPHSKGPGAKTYRLTAYALAAPVPITTAPSAVSRELLLAAMKDLILDSAELKVTYDRTGAIGGQGGKQQDAPK
jgi:phosphatidylethanolamine-binding protein (PEBP) family uncharacterized protein